jgi:hypothetical protein
MRHHKEMKARSSVPRTDEHALLRQEDFMWLAEINKVLSPYWSARSGYENEKVDTLPKN